MRPRVHPLDRVATDEGLGKSEKGQHNQRAVQEEQYIDNDEDNNAGNALAANKARAINKLRIG